MVVDSSCQIHYKLEFLEKKHDLVSKTSKQKPLVKSLLDILHTLHTNTIKQNGPAISTIPYRSRRRFFHF
jgi:hypothetical protein